MKKLRWAFVFFLLAAITTAEAGEFDLSETSPREVVSIPGKNIKAGMFRYDYQEVNEGKIEDESTNKAGIIVNDEVIYYVSEEGMEHSGVDPGGDNNFGVYKDYVLMDSWSHWSSHNRMMYLFRLKGTNVELLDMISMGYSGGKGEMYGSDFMSVIDGEWTESPPTPAWTKVQDIDNDGNPEVKIVILPNAIPELYLEIKNDRLHVDLNPALYKPLFEREKLKKRKKKTSAYYIYGFLAGELTLDDIKVMSESREGQRERIISFLKYRDKWDAAFHNHGGDKPVLLKKYIKKGR
ncbi:MAG: hypothetical protein HZB85_02245 [Deltaproteobacteria bacterium]|nr:hypothetical protein [Deltaproteobacteria bacterium]